MKTSALLGLTVAPGFAFAGIGISWKFGEAPASGLNDVTFGFNVANAVHKRGYYYAQQFNFLNVSSVGYTGVQPQDDVDGKSRIRGVFSSFQKGATSTHPNCSDGADGGAGVSCGVTITHDLTNTFNCVVENIGGTTWRGTLVDSVTGDSTVIGEYTLPDGAGGIRNGQVGFLENFLANGNKNWKCHDSVPTEVSFYNPTSNTSGAGSGTVGKPYEYGSCVGDQNFVTTQGDGYWTINSGFQQ